MFDEMTENAREVDGRWQVAPANAEECVSFLRTCGERGLSVTPVGGGTKMGWGNPVAADAAIETRRIAGVHEHSWQDMTAIVGAGTTWAEMQQALSRHGQMVALDPLWPERATVGGIVATNDAGALRLKYGSLRDLIIGMTVVLADGTIAKSGGKVVKNVAGYDLHKLMTGAFGTLGIITEVTFRLHPVEKHMETWTLRAPEAAPLGAVMLRLLDSTLSPASVQMRQDVKGFALDVRFSGLPESTERLHEMAGALECARAEEGVWSARERLFIGSDAFVLKATMLPSKIAVVLEGFAMSTGVKAECVADAVGICTVAVHGETAQVMHLVEDLRLRLAANDGAVVVLQAPKSTAEIDRWGGLPAALALMREVKQQFDPARMLNPGRFVGGI